MSNDFTRGDWHGPHLADDDCSCNCTSIVSESYSGSICLISVNNGIARIDEGGNDAPPLEEAKANGRLIRAAGNTASQLADAGYDAQAAIELTLETLKALESLNFWMAQGQFSAMPMAAIHDMHEAKKAARVLLAKVHGEPL